MKKWRYVVTFDYFLTQPGYMCKYIIYIIYMVYMSSLHLCCRGSFFYNKGIIFANFQFSGKECFVKEGFITCVKAGRMLSIIIFIIVVLISSNPVEPEFLR